MTFVCLFFFKLVQTTHLLKGKYKNQDDFFGDVGFLPQVSPEHAIDKEFLFFAFVYLIQPSNRVFYEGGKGSGSEER